MHIPASMLNGAVCPVTLAVGAVGVGIAAYVACKSKDKPSSARFAAVTALIFALQMLNYPVQNGTSGHLVGAMLGVSLLGMPFAVLSMSIVLAVQAFFFGDGGVNALGANVLNMALIGAGFLGFVFNRAVKAGLNQKLGLAIASLLSVLAGAAACSIEVALSGAVAFNKVMPAMLTVHMLIGFGEAFLTVALVTVLQSSERYWKANEQTFAFGAGALAIVAVALSPFASGFPDGLEWVADKLSFAQFQGFEISAILPDYQASFIGNAAFSTITAGMIGVSIVFGLTFAISEFLKKTRVSIS
ncbi:MAG: energy-coupling factor ABC transporter permease [Candidatus Omnitrophota bacterium]|nr:energy-coupling factor ABC transporter permease [Candidatus Omnitrophota bacterium]